MNSTTVHGALALLGLVFAYLTYTRPPEPEQVVSTSEAVVLACDAASITRLEMETPSHGVVIVPKRSGKEVAFWMTSQRKKAETPKPEASPAAGASGGTAGASAAAKAEPEKAPEPPKEVEARPFDPEAPVEFVASPKFDEVVTWVTPFKASRSLGKLGKERLAEFGLDKPTTFLRMACGGKQVALDIGARTYGAGDQYARDPKSGEVFLLDGKKLMDLQSAQYKFMQSDLHTFTLADVDGATITAAGKTRKLAQRNRETKEAAAWVDASQPDKRNELFANWFQRIGRMRAKGYLKDAQEPGKDLQVEAGAPTPVVTIEYTLEGKPKGKLEVVRVDTTTKQGNLYYARTEATRRWVTLYDSIAKQVEDDVALVVGAEEAPAESQSVGPAASEAPAPSGAPTAPLPPGHPAVPGQGHAH